MTPTPTPPTEKCCRKCEPGWMHDGHSHSEEWMMHQSDECTNETCPCHTTDKGLDKLDLTIQELIEQVQEHGGARTSDIQGIKNVAQHIAKEEYKRGLGKGVYELKSLKGYIEQMEADGRVEIAWIKENIDGNIRNLEAALET